MNKKLFWIAFFALLCACSNSSEREALFATVSNNERDSTGSTAIVAEESGDLAATISSVMTVEPMEFENVQLTPILPGTAYSGQEAVVAAVSNLPQVQNYLDDLSETDQFMGTVLIAQDGEILINEGYGFADIESGRPNTSQTQYRIGSLTKQFTAAAILRLQELGKLNVTDPVSVYLPDYDGEDQITVHQLLTHTAGVPNYTKRSDLAQLVQTPIALPELMTQFSSQPLDFLPGQQFAYSDSGYVILTAVIEAVSGMSYADFLQEQFFSRLNMTQTGYDFRHDTLAEPATGYHLTPGGPQRAVETESSWASGAGALYSTTDDLFRWERALSSNHLLQEASLKSMFTPWVEMGQGYSYGYGWEIGRLAGRSAQTHAGNIFGFGSFIARFPENEATIIVLGNGLQKSPRILAEDLANILFKAGSP